MSSEGLLGLCENSLHQLNEEAIAIEHNYIENGDIVLHKLSYKHLNDAVTKISSVIAKHSANGGEVIGLPIPPCTELIVGMLSILKAKCAFAPLDLKAKSDLLNDITRLTSMQWVLALSRMRDFVENLFSNYGYSLQVTEEVEICETGTILLFKITCSMPPADFDFCKIAYVLHTSGSTGTPKIIAVPHESIVPNIVHLGALFKVGRSSKVAMMSPPTFDPSIVEIFMALSNGATLIVPSLDIKMNPTALLDVLFSQANVTVLQATPAVVERFPLVDLRDVIFCDKSSLKVMAFGGEQCPSYKTINNWINTDSLTRNILPNVFFNIYGITEVSSWATCYELPEEKILNPHDSAVPLGQPLWNTSLQIKTGDTNPYLLCTIYPSYENDSVFCTQKPSMVMNIKDSQQITGKLFIGGKDRLCHILGQADEMYRDSGDMVELMQESGEIRFLGRTDSVVKRNGKKLNLHILSEKISQLPNIKSCHVMEIDSHIIAFVLKENDDTFINNINQIHFLNSMQTKLWILECYKQLVKISNRDLLPDRILEINTIPVTSHGKVDGYLLENLYREMIKYQQQDTDNKDKLPGGKIKEVILSMLEILLNHNVDLDANFHQLGGDSLSAAIFINWLDMFIEKNVTEAVPNILEIMFQLSIKNFLDNLTTKLTNSNVNRALPPAQKRKKLDDELTIHHTEHTHDKNTDILASFSRGGRCRYFNRTSRIVNVDEELNAPVVLQPHLKISASELWKYDTGKCIDASPLVILTSVNEGICYIGSHSHLFSAVSLSDGWEIWKAVLPDRIESSSCFFTSASIDLVVVGCYDGGVYFFEALTGKHWWKFTTDGEVKSSPCFSDVNNLVYVGSHDGCLYALDPVRKECKWQSHCGGGAIFPSPSVIMNENYQNEVVIVATLGGKLFCLSGNDGEEIWKAGVGKPIFSSPLCTESGICIGCVDSCIYFFNHKGEKVWTFKTAQPVFSSPSLVPDKQSIVVGSHDGYLYSIYIKDGSLLWKSVDKTDGSAIYSAPCSFGLKGRKEVVVYTSTAGHLYLISGANGDVFLKTKLPGEVFSSPVVIHSHDKTIKIIVGCRDDNLYCFTVDGLQKNILTRKITHWEDNLLQS